MHQGITDRYNSYSSAAFTGKSDEQVSVPVKTVVKAPKLISLIISKPKNNRKMARNSGNGSAESERRIFFYPRTILKN